jgi:uncharacterized protein YbjT (DUF2867 family)
VILVTGGTGFVGPKIVHALRAEGHQVRVLVRKPGSKVAGTLATWGCELAQGAMEDAESLRRATVGTGTIVHLVSIPPVGPPEKFERVMVQGTRDLVAGAKDAGVRRFILMSALGTGQETKDLASYFRAKWEEERTVAESGIEHVVFRPSFVFGPDGGVLQGAIRAVRFSPIVPVLAAERKLQPIWGEDVAAFFAKAISLDAATNRTFELGGPDVVTWRELWERIERVLGKRRANLGVPMGVLRGLARVGDLLPPTRGASDGVKMLDYGDSVTDIGPAVEALGIRPIGLTEQIRRAIH